MCQRIVEAYTEEYCTIAEDIENEGLIFALADKMEAEHDPVMLAVSLIQRKGSVREKLLKLPYPVRFTLIYGLFLIVLLMGAYGIGYDAGQFIYNQF